MTEQNRPADETGQHPEGQGGPPVDRTTQPPSGSDQYPAAPGHATPTPQVPGAGGQQWPAAPSPGSGWQAAPPTASQPSSWWHPTAGHQASPGQYGWATDGGVPPQAAGSPAGSPSWQQVGDHGSAAGTASGSGGQFPPAGGLPPAFEQPAAKPARAGRGRLVIAALLAGALIGGGAGAGVVALTDDDPVSTPAAAQSVVIKNADNATTATAAAAKASPSVVTVYVTGGQSSGSGSGIVYSADGYVVTNNHVVTLDSTTTTAAIQVRTADGTLYDATVVGTDPTSDLAVIKLTGASGLTPATWADSDDVQVGDLAVAIGAPLGLSNTVTDGIISATKRAVQTGSDTNVAVIQALQTDAAINPGNSGGALVNAEGEVIGVNSAIATVSQSDSGQGGSQSGNIGVGFAIPSNTVQRIADQIVKTGSATHALLGVQAKTATADGSQVGQGAQVAEVTDGSAAADAGLQVGDVITGIDGTAVTTSTELTAAVRSAGPGQQVTLTVKRSSGTQQVDVTLGTATS